MNDDEFHENRYEIEECLLDKVDILEHQLAVAGWWMALWLFMIVIAIAGCTSGDLSYATHDASTLSPFGGACEASTDCEQGWCLTSWQGEALPGGLCSIKCSWQSYACAYGSCVWGHEDDVGWCYPSCDTVSCREGWICADFGWIDLCVIEEQV